jgi:hypothetical protein
MRPHLDDDMHRGTQARFRRINRLTLAFNVPLYAGLAGLLAVGMGLIAS